VSLLTHTLAVGRTDCSPAQPAGNRGDAVNAGIPRTPPPAVSGDVRFSAWFATLFVMRPHPDDFDRLDVIQNLIDEAVLNVDPA